VKAEVPDDLGGERADRVLARIGSMSRREARTLIEAGGLRADGVLVDTARSPLPAGTSLVFEAPESRPILEPMPVEFGVAYEDADLAVVDKPAGVVTHPGAGFEGATLASGILHRWPTVRGVGSSERWGIVHRLDRDTSGLLVVSLSARAFEPLKKAIAERRVHREYLALVEGRPAATAGTIDAALGRDPDRRGRMRLDPAGRAARTHYSLESNHGDLSLLRVTLETGRTHQIRVHLASVGLPVAGDDVYGTGEGSPRLFLHSCRIALHHPVTGEDVDAESALPDDLAAVLRA
jgi:23S rRNA pseudouridine1911/1915/1917 synthase